MKIRSIPGMESSTLTDTQPYVTVHNKRNSGLPIPTWDVTLVSFLAECFRYSASWIIWLALFVKVNYPRLRSLMKTHCFGFVDRKTLKERTAICNSCPHRFTHKGGDFCKEDHCGCGCWKGSRISYKRRLSGFRCPRDKFGYGKLKELWMSRKRVTNGCR